jgi:2-keto-3-deoxy-6-phosphogluconate aldolase
VCPANGIDQNNFTDYLSLPNVNAISTTWLTPRNEHGKFDLEVIRKRVRDMLARLPQPVEQIV